MQNYEYFNEINLEGNNITSISQLIFSNLEGLFILNLNNNYIKNLTPFAGLTGLRELYLNNNQIEDISPITANMPDLLILHISENNIADISTLINLVKLKTLDISYNNISNIDVLYNIQRLGYESLPGLRSIFGAGALIIGNNISCVIMQDYYDRFRLDQINVPEEYCIIE